MSYAVVKDSGSRLTGLVVVVAFHVVLIYALVHGLARKIVEVIHQPLQTKIIEEIKPPPPDKPPPPPPKFTPPPPPFIPLPEVQIQVPVSAMALAITAVTSVKPEPVRTASVVDANACEKPPYPAASIRANEVGTVRLSFLIDADGKVLDSKVERSSGHRSLDEAARTGLRLCKFKPATVDGRPERSWARIDYVWKIQ